VEKGKYSEKKFVIKKIADLIKKHPDSVASALKHSNVFIENPNDKRELIEKVAYHIVNNNIFKKNISIVIAHGEVGDLAKGIKLKSEDFSNLGGGVDKGKVASEAAVTIGQATGAGAQSGGAWGAIIGAVVGIVNAGFGVGRASKEAKIEELKAKSALFEDVFPTEEKINWTPIIIISGVLIVGGIVTFLALKD